ncbi:MAG TPA: hypothetical protein VEC58_03875 [Roseiarcus sp.]|nr:hypothetical protein [Roseiarcus sp.]
MIPLKVPVHQADPDVRAGSFRRPLTYRNAQAGSALNPKSRSGRIVMSGFWSIVFLAFYLAIPISLGLAALLDCQDAESEGL